MEAIIKELLGGLLFQLAQAQAQIKALQDEIAALKKTEDK